MNKLFDLALSLILFGTPIVGEGKTVNNDIAYELIFPLEMTEAHAPVPDITASVNGKVIYNGPPWSNPVTNLPVIRNAKSSTPKIALKVKSENIEKVFEVDLTKGIYLIVHYDPNKRSFKLEQEKVARGYD